MLSNFDIQRICNKLKLPIVGVFSKDELRTQNRKIGSYYVNMENSNEGEGTHWVLAKIYDDDSRDEDRDMKEIHKVGALYFDPFGLDMPKEIETFLSPFKPIPYNNRQIQSINTSECGWYCISCDYALEHKKNDETYLEDFEKYIALWSDKPSKNLKLLKSFFKPL
jgi:hypothetical protein